MARIVNWIKSWFARKTLMVEAPATAVAARPDAEIQAALKALQFNLGFAWLQARLDIASRYLASRLQNEHHESIRDVDSLQLGIQWCHWLRREIAQATAQPSSPTKPPEEEIEALFKELDSQIERVSVQ